MYFNNAILPRNGHSLKVSRGIEQIMNEGSLYLVVDVSKGAKPFIIAKHVEPGPHLAQVTTSDLSDEIH